MNRLITALMGLIVFTSLSVASANDSLEKGMEFTAGGSRIQPGCVALFNQQAMVYPVVLGIDINRCRRDNKISRMTRKDKDLIYFLYQNGVEGGGDGYYGYKVVGQTTNGVYVLHSFSQFPQAEEVFDGLLFVTLKEKTIDVYSTAKEPLQMRTTQMLLTGYLAGGDRCSGGIKSASVSGNKVTVLKYPSINSVKQCEGAKSSVIDLGS